jgi:hypothetical protein
MASPINFCHIAPIPHLKDFVSTNNVHLTLAHLVETSDEYADFYHNRKSGQVIMDNSAFEMYKQGRPMYDPSKLIDMARRCRADYIVMSDYPGESWLKTKHAAQELIPQIKQAGFKTFYVPQSEPGHLEGYIASLVWALEDGDVDMIGLSILGVPMAMGIKQDHNKAYFAQRFLSRWRLFQILDQRGYLSHTERATKRFHCLGMQDGPNEILLLKPWAQHIYSWDSSAAVWAGLNYIKFDSSPTGLMHGKYEAEVDFNFKASPATIKHVMRNINYINSLCA